jgi:ribose 5-phosphate isomerase B
MLYLGADHGGYALKEYIKEQLLTSGVEFVDFGADALYNSDDYPDYAAKVSAVVSAKPDTERGILICRSGQGMCIVANKYPGVRAALAWNPRSAQAARKDDASNILCLPADHLIKSQALKVVMAWLTTDPSPADRHHRRLQKIKQLEKKIHKK